MIMSNTPLPQAIVDRSANNWADARIVKPFQKFGHVVGLHIERGGQTTALHFSSIEDRLEARWNEIEAELKALWAYWTDEDTPRGEVQRVSKENDALLAEKQHIEGLWLEVRSHIPEQAEVAS
jgi:hypothetical protein